MAYTQCYGSNESFFSLEPVPLYESPSSSTISDSSDADTLPGIDVFNNSSASSQLSGTLNANIIENYENMIDESDLEFMLSNASLPPSPFDALILEDLLNPNEYETTCVIAQPQARYRGRYKSEIDKDKDRASRFIQAENKINGHKYPTIKIPQQWRRPNLTLYIRVTLVTTISQNAPVSCIHPYKIDADESESVFKDPDSNSLFFRIYDKDFEAGEKSFCIILMKTKQDDLKSHGLMRLLDSDLYDVQRIQNLTNAKQLIKTYQLQKSRFHFTLMERLDDTPNFKPIYHTSITSDIMLDTNNGKTNSSMNDQNCTTFTNATIKCVPQKGDWQGGDEMVLIMPNAAQQKEVKVYFDYGQYGSVHVTQTSYVDRKTILLRIPPCLKPLSNDNFTASIILQQNNSSFPPIAFNYLAPIRPTHVCSQCRSIIANGRTSHKRPHIVYDNDENDGAESLIFEMNQLSIEQIPVESRPRGTSTSSLDEEAKMDIYLNKLKDSVVDFVRTNNPSRLFRRTRLLLAKCDENPPPLNDAIQRGHTDLALSLIEQAVAMRAPNGLLEKESDHGETPLLIAAKVNQWKLIEVILSKRSDLAQQKDNEGNNLLHLLANLSEDDKVAETIKNVLEIISNDMKGNLLKQKNENNQTAMEIAQTHGNIQCMELLKCSVDVEENNV